MISVVPETFPGGGAIIVSVGASVSCGLLTVTIVPDEVVELPAASRAIAVNEYIPLATVNVFQEIEYGAVRSSAPN